SSPHLFPHTTPPLPLITTLFPYTTLFRSNMHGSTGDIVLIGTQTPQLEEIFHDLTHKLNNDLGGSGSNLRTPAACMGQSRCEYRSEEHTSELQSRFDIVCRLLLEKKKHNT